MSQAPPYVRATDFSSDELLNVGGRSTVRTDKLDAELDALGATANALVSNVSLNQRDDGEIRDQRVKLFTLSPEVLKLITFLGGVVRGAWTTATAYAIKDVVTQGGNTYVAATAHTSGVFATDLAAVKWVLVQLGSATAASGVPFTPTGTLAATDVQAAINEADTENRAISGANDVAIRADIADSATIAKGAGQVGFGSTIVYLANTVGAAIRSIFASTGSALVGYLSSMAGAIARTVQGRLDDSVSAFDFMTAAQIADVKAFNYTLDVSAAVQAALNTSREAYFPRGGYRIGATLTTPYTCKLKGSSWFESRLVKYGGGVLMTTLDGAVGAGDNVQIEDLYLDGVTGTGVTGIGPVGGVYTKYISNLKLKNVHFTRELLNGIDANVIYLYAQSCTWGAYGTAAPVGAKHINLQTGGPLNPNLVQLVDCRLSNLPAATTSMTVNTGAGILLQLVDFTAVGRALQTINCGQVTLDTVYTEACSHAVSVFAFDNVGQTPVIVRSAINRNNTSPAIYGYTTGTFIEFQSDATGLGGLTKFFMVNTSTSSNAVPKDGSVSLKNHFVTGNANDPTLWASGIAPGVLVPRAWAKINSAGAGSILASSDPNLSIARNGTGDISVTFSNACTSGNACVPFATGETTRASAVASGGGTIARVQCFNSAGAATDDTFSVIVYGK